MHGRKLRHRAQAAVWVVLLLPTVVGAAVFGLDSGLAQAGTYARSWQPYWTVGTLDTDLSLACRRGRFNQRSDHRRHIGYLGESGGGTTGIARQNWNLRDPERRSRPEETYHFADDGMSTCRVYVAKDPLPRQR